MPPVPGVPSVPRLRPGGLERPHPSRLSLGHPGFDRILDAHRRAVAEGRPGYTDPDTGLFVMTSAWLAARGSCCDQGCRHCPYLGAAS